MWQRTYQKLSNWLQNHDGVFPRRGARSSEEKSLANFVGKAQKHYRAGKLTQYKRDRLLLLHGWSWGVRSGSWDATLVELRQWLATHDNDYPRRRSEHREEKRLAEWIHNRRKDYARERLSEDKTVRLEALPGWE